ncbi:carbohydrate-binding protein [Xanthomonas sp. NCPPB 1067]|uniref:rhamnogalacturonan lyase family protein n=1 Tax=Xanthomonas sp. NCPPB 1067 TaxID=487524 RepID=UPI001E609E8F|nr:carbohydrate-binding protein [Xanthomonas sp. NCPPB 1067]MCC4587590.1 carbohydrate-binding protein [Xanthomonas sp. NCPPB 1067]
MNYRSRMRGMPLRLLVLTAAITPCLAFAGSLAENGIPNVAGPRAMEALDRGVVALRTSSGVFVSWRLLGLDPDGIAFNVYRSTDGKAATKLNAAPLTQGTNFSDTTAPAGRNSYSVRPVVGGTELPADGQFELKADANGPLVRIPLSTAPGDGYHTRYVWVGDLDGDGQYEFVLDRIPPQNPADYGLSLSNQYLDAYKMDGTHLWRIDMGINSRNIYRIRPGSATLSTGMYDGVTVYDLNGDGKAEVVLKVANGVKFADGKTFTAATDEDQSVAILDGQKGTLLASTPFPADFASAGRLGTQFGIGSVDGMTPSIMFWGRNRNKDHSFNDVFASWSWRGGKQITTNWVWPRTSGLGLAPSHQLRIIDLDGDGKDEVMTGTFAINSNGTLRYGLPGVVHGDRFYIGKFEKDRPGLQGYGIQQYNPSGLLEYYYDATKGTILWTHSTNDGTSVDVGRGLVGDIDARFPGYEAWSFSGIHNGATGQRTEPSDLAPYPTHSIWWDGDELNEGLNGPKIEKWDPLKPRDSGHVGRYELLTNQGAALWDGFNPMFFGDIIGDWRTEVVAINAAGTELLMFSTQIPTDRRHYTMAHNPAYRNHMTIKGYLQSPLLDYYFGGGMGASPRPRIHYAGDGWLQAETAVLSGGAKSTTSNASGYTGTGFVTFPGNGGVAQFPFVDVAGGGTKDVTIRFANGGSSRSGIYRLNGKTYPITFPTTGSWSRWSNLTIKMPFAKGSGNTLSFESTGNDLANIDWVLIGKK